MQAWVQMRRTSHRVPYLLPTNLPCCWKCLWQRQKTSQDYKHGYKWLQWSHRWTIQPSGLHVSQLSYRVQSLCNLVPSQCDLVPSLCKLVSLYQASVSLYLQSCKRLPRAIRVLPCTSSHVHYELTWGIAHQKPMKLDKQCDWWSDDYWFVCAD